MKSIEEIKSMDRAEMLREIKRLRISNGQLKNFQTEVNADFNMLHIRLIKLNKVIHNVVLNRILDNIFTPISSAKSRPTYKDEEGMMDS